MARRNEIVSNALRNAADALSSNDKGSCSYTMMERYCYTYNRAQACQKYTKGYCQGCAFDLVPYVGADAARASRFSRWYKEEPLERQTRMTILVCVLIVAVAIIVGVVCSSCSTLTGQTAYDVTQVVSSEFTDYGVPVKGVTDLLIRQFLLKFVPPYIATTII